MQKHRAANRPASFLLRRVRHVRNASCRVQPPGCGRLALVGTTGDDDVVVAIKDVPNRVEVGGWSALEWVARAETADLARSARAAAPLFLRVLDATAQFLPEVDRGQRRCRRSA